MIGIFGDSFATIDYPKKYPNNRSWTGLTAEILNEHHVCHGQSSTSIWWSYELFLKHYKKYDKIVFTYSHYSRWSYLPEHLIGLSLIRPEGTINSPGFESHQDESMKKYVDILLKAHPIVYSEELQIFTYQNVFNSVNNLCKENNIKLINLMPFEQNYVNLELRKKLINFYIDISNATGSCLTGLADVSFGEALDKNGILQSDIIFKMGIDYRASHLSLENNKVLASIIADTFNSDQIGHTRLQEDARFLKGTLCNEN